jgi:hypothetical protein
MVPIQLPLLPVNSARILSQIMVPLNLAELPPVLMPSVNSMKVEPPLLPLPQSVLDVLPETFLVLTLLVPPLPVPLKVML